MSWRLILLVLGLQVDPFLNEVFDDVVSLKLDGIVDGALDLVVYVVVVGSKVDQELSCAQVTLSHTVEDASLAVLVATIDAAAALLYEELAHARVALSRCVEEGTLLEIIFPGRISAHVNKNLAHLEGRFFVLNHTGGEDDSLTIVFGLVEKR